MLPSVKRADPHASNRRNASTCTLRLCAVKGTCAFVAAKAQPVAPYVQEVVVNQAFGQRELSQERLQQLLSTPVAAGELATVNRHGEAHSQQRSQSIRPTQWTFMHARLLESLRRMPELLPQGSRVLVAVSGGQDSMALLRLLLDLQRPIGKQQQVAWPLQLVVGHCDHNLRPDSAANADFVQAQVVTMSSASWLEAAASNCRKQQQTGPHAHAQAQALAHVLQDSLQQQEHSQQNNTSPRRGLWQAISNPQRQADEPMQQAAEHVGLPYHCRTANRLLRSEAAARSWRHQMLQEMALEAGCTHVALGHTATDRAETLMLNLIRGAGPSGLSSMGWGRPMGDSGVQLVRPLLKFSREETEQLCELTNTQFYVDSTNNDERFSRNRIRLKVFPQLEMINHQAVLHISQTSELLAADSTFLDSMAQRALQKVSRECYMVLVPRKKTAASAAASSSSSSGPIAEDAEDDMLLAQCVRTAGLPVLRCSDDALAVSGQYCKPHQTQLEQDAGGMVQQTYVLQPGHMYCRRRSTEAATAAEDDDAGDDKQQQQQQLPKAWQALSVQHLRRLPPPLRFRVIYSWLQQQDSVRAVSYHMVQEVRDLLKSDSPATCRSSTLCAEHCVVKSQSLLVFVRNKVARYIMIRRLRLLSSATQSVVRSDAEHASRYRHWLLAESFLRGNTANYSAVGSTQQQQQQQQATENLHQLLDQFSELVAALQSKQLPSQQLGDMLQQRLVQRQQQQQREVPGHCSSPGFPTQHSSQARMVHKDFNKHEQQLQQRLGDATGITSRSVGMAVAGHAGLDAAVSEPNLAQGPAINKPALVTAAHTA